MTDCRLRKAPQPGAPVRPDDFEPQADAQWVATVLRALSTLARQTRVKHYSPYEWVTGKAPLDKLRPSIKEETSGEDTSFVGTLAGQKASHERLHQVLAHGKVFQAPGSDGGRWRLALRGDANAGNVNYEFIWERADAIDPGLAEPKPGTELPPRPKSIMLKSLEDMRKKIRTSLYMPEGNGEVQDWAIDAAVRARLLDFDSKVFEARADGVTLHEQQRSTFLTEGHLDTAVVALSLRTAMLPQGLQLLVDERDRTVGYASASPLNPDFQQHDHEIADHGDNLTPRMILWERPQDNAPVSLMFSGFRLRPDVYDMPDARAKLLEAACAVCDAYVCGAEPWHIESVMLRLTQPTARHVIETLAPDLLDADSVVLTLSREQLAELYQAACKAAEREPDDAAPCYDAD